MKQVNELDRAELKQDFKNMHKDIGVPGSLQVLYELLVSAEVLSELLSEVLGEKRGK